MTDTPDRTSGYDAFDGKILDAVAQQVADDGHGSAIVTGYVVLAEWTDEQGESQFFGCGMQGQTASRSVGMIVYGEEHERELMRANIRRGFEDDDRD